MVCIDQITYYIVKQFIAIYSTPLPWNAYVCHHIMFDSCELIRQLAMIELFAFIAYIGILLTRPRIFGQREMNDDAKEDGKK